MRVEQLAARADVTVDTIRYYQSKGLLDPPRREGRVAWYGQRHLERLSRIRSLQGRGFTLATIARLVSGISTPPTRPCSASCRAGGTRPRHRRTLPAPSPGTNVIPTERRTGSARTGSTRKRAY